MFLNSENYLGEVEKLFAEANSVDMAVAFWGTGAESLIRALEKKPVRIVCNLTSGGTNPSVVKNILKAGVQVRHLSDLHSKVIIGQRTVILGSANCSANGLNLEGEEVKGWQEAGYVIRSTPEITQIQDWFEERWNDAEEITPELLDRARTIWKARRKTRIPAGKNTQSVLSIPPTSLAERNIVVAIYRDRPSSEALNTLEERKQRENDDALTKSWTFYEDWSEEELRKGMVVIDVYIGKRGGVTIDGPYKIFEVTHTVRKEGEFKGETMTLHYANRTIALLGLSPKIALAGLKDRVAAKAFELLPLDADAKVIPLEKFVTLI
jgi:hypothetical protein